MADGDENHYIPIRYDYTKEVVDHIKRHRKGMDIAPKTVENAYRRGQLKFYQIGGKRYTTPELIDEWLESLITTAGAVRPTAVGE